MNITNFIVALILSFIDITIIEFYLSKTHKLKTDINSRHFLIIEFLLFTIINMNILKSHFFNLIVLILITFISIQKYIYSKRNVLKFVFLILSMNLIIDMILESSLAWIIDTAIKTNEFHRFLSYKLLSQIIFRYIEYIIIIFILNKTSEKKIPLYYFKIISIAFSIYFGIVVIVNNDKLFYFRNIGRTFVFIIIIYNIALIMFDRYQRKAEDTERELTIAKQNVSLEQQYIKEVGEKNKQMQEFRHDIKNRAMIITGLIHKGNDEDAIRELEKILGESMNLSMNIYVNNVYVDTIIDAKIQLMKRKGIVFNEVYGPVNIGYIDPYDLALVLALAMDNAIEAVDKIKYGPREISLDIHSKMNLIVVTLSNSVLPNTKIYSGFTSKTHLKDRHGFGVKKIKSIAESYNGDANYQVYKDKVVLKLYMSIEKDEHLS